MNFEQPYSTNRLIFNLILSALIFFSAGILYSKGIVFYSVLLFLTGGIITYGVFRFYRTSNLSIGLFFESLMNNDTGFRFPEIKSNSILAGLYKSMNQLIKYFQILKTQNAANEQYYKALIHHSATGMVVMNHANEIELMNETAARYAGLSPETIQFKNIRIKHPDLYDALCRLKPGETNTFRNVRNGEILFLFFRATKVSRNEESVKLISIQDIKQELESREIESYRKLISVLTHEIMNMVTPITAVSGSLNSTFTLKQEKSECKEYEIQTINGLRLIEEQSRGIMNFVNNYRKITKLPEPVFQEIAVKAWINQLEVSFRDTFASHKINFQTELSKSLQIIQADKNLLNQVMINLINNAVEALSEVNRERVLIVRTEINRNNRAVIKVINNGPLIPSEIQENVFVPFFTTRKNGSGIGLSLSNEIIKMHKGSLSLISNSEDQTVFTIELFR